MSTTEFTDLQEKWASKIAGLLRKAETTTPEEAQLLVDKAQALMAKYSIEETMLRQERGDATEEVIEKVLSYPGNYRLALAEIGEAIAKANECRLLYSVRNNTSHLYVIGFQSDVERVVMLDSSLQIQAQSALLAAVRSGEVNYQPWMSGNDRFLERRQFLFGFASGLRARLRKATEAGRGDYVSEQVERGAEASQVTQGMELALRSRRDRIDDWVDQTYGKLRSGRSSAPNYGSGDSHRAGYHAGLKADTGSPRVGQRRALPR